MEPRGASPHPCFESLRIPSVLCRSHTRYPQLLKAALNVFIAEERALDGPEDLAHGATAQTGFYTHRGLDGRIFGKQPPPMKSCYRRISVLTG